MNSKMERIKHNPLDILCNICKTTRLKRNLAKAELKIIPALTFSQGQDVEGLRRGGSRHIPGNAFILLLSLNYEISIYTSFWQ